MVITNVCTPTTQSMLNRSIGHQCVNAWSWVLFYLGKIWSPNDKLGQSDHCSLPSAGNNEFANPFVWFVVLPCVWVLTWFAMEKHYCNIAKEQLHVNLCCWRACVYFQISILPSSNGKAKTNRFAKIMPTLRAQRLCSTVKPSVLFMLFAVFCARECVDFLCALWKRIDQIELVSMNSGQWRERRAFVLVATFNQQWTGPSVITGSCVCVWSSHSLIQPFWSTIGARVSNILSKSN